MCQIPRLELSKSERELLEKIIVAAKSSQVLFDDVFRQRGQIHDRGLYWTVGKVNQTLSAMIRLTELLLNTNHPTSKMVC